MSPDYCPSPLHLLHPSPFNLTRVQGAPVGLALWAQLEPVCSSMIVGDTAVKQTGTEAGFMNLAVNQDSACLLPLLGLCYVTSLICNIPCCISVTGSFSPLKTQVQCLLLWEVFLESLNSMLNTTTFMLPYFFF